MFQKCMKCMKKGKKNRYRTLTKRLRQGIGQNLDGRRDFGEKKVFWIKREVREIEIFEKVQNQVESQKFI